MRLEIDGLGFGYSSSKVLDGICMRMEGPQFVSILGPNGVGKSTLVNCICRVLEPDEGAVLLDGRDVSGMNVKEIADNMAYVPYSTGDSFPLTVVDAVLMGRQSRSGFRTTDEDLTKVYEALHRLGIEDLALRQFNELSAGQHQKVVLARGLVQEPRVLLLDEPTANLDIRHQMDVSELLRDLSREKRMTVIMICHDINIASRYSDNIIMMYRGSIYAVGTPEQVVTPENIRAVYGVDSTVIRANGRPHVILNGTLPDDEGGWRSPYTASEPAVVDIPEMSE